MFKGGGEREVELKVPDSVKLTVVGRSDGGYLVNNNSNFPDVKVESLAGVIDYMSKLGRPVLKATPTYAYLQEYERELVEVVRHALTRREDMIREGYLTRDSATPRT